MTRRDRRSQRHLWILRAFLVATALLGLVASNARADGELASARAFLTNVHAEIARIRTSTDRTPDEKRALLDTRLLTWLDVTSMATRALGQNMGAFSKEEFGEFVEEYGRFLTDVYLREIARSDPAAKISIEQESMDEKTGVVTLGTVGEPRESLATAKLPWRDTGRDRVFRSTYTLRRLHDVWRIETIRFQGVDLNRAFEVQIAGALKKITPAQLLEKLRAYNASREGKNPLA